GNGECGSRIRTTVVGWSRKVVARCLTIDRDRQVAGNFASSGVMTRPFWKTSSTGNVFCSKLRTRNKEETAPNCRVMAAITCPRKSSSSGTEASASRHSRSASFAFANSVAHCCANSSRSRAIVACNSSARLSSVMSVLIPQTAYGFPCGRAAEILQRSSSELLLPSARIPGNGLEHRLRSLADHGPGPLEQLQRHECQSRFCRGFDHAEPDG